MKEERKETPDDCIPMEEKRRETAQNERLNAKTETDSYLVKPKDRILQMKTSNFQLTSLSLALLKNHLKTHINGTFST